MKQNIFLRWLQCYKIIFSKDIIALWYLRLLELSSCVRNQ